MAPLATTVTTSLASIISCFSPPPPRPPPEARLLGLLWKLLHTHLCGLDIASASTIFPSSWMLQPLLTVSGQGLFFPLLPTALYTSHFLTMTLDNTRKRLLRGQQNPPVRRRGRTKQPLAILLKNWQGWMLVTESKGCKQGLSAGSVSPGDFNTHLRTRADSDLCSIPREVMGSEMESRAADTSGSLAAGWGQLPSQCYLQLCKLGATSSFVHMSLFSHFLSEVKYLAPNTDSGWQSQYSNPGFIPRPFSSSCSETEKLKDT